MPKASARHTMVAVGSKNPAKVEGVRLAFRALGACRFVSVDASPVSKTQPFTLAETVRGATRRAKFAQLETGSDYGVGVEAGVFRAAAGHYINLQMAAIVDSLGGTSLGCSSGFPLPPAFVSRLRRDGRELDRYAHEITGAKTVREEDGVVYHLTAKRYTRIEMTEQCVTMALVPWLNDSTYHLRAKRRPETKSSPM